MRASPDTLKQVHADGHGARSARTPVLLVHGWNARGRSLRFVVAHLERNGWARESMLALDFDRYGSNITHARAIADAVEALRQRTGALRIDIVAHSMGGLATRWCIARHLDATLVRRVVFVATPHHGTWMSWLAWGEGAAEMRPGSRFLRDLERHAFPESIRTFTIRTRLETHVVPPHSALWPPADADHVLNFPPHSFLLRSRAVADHVRACLDLPDVPR